MKYLTVKNWREFQHYKKRDPIWIKLHRALLEDYQFAALKDKTKAHLVMIWLIAASNDGRVPHDAKFIGSRINANDPVDLDAILAAGFLIPEDGVSIEETPAHKGNGSHKLIEQTGEVIERIPMIGGEEFEVRDSFAKEMTAIYLNVDVPLTLKEIRGWCIGNPTKLKTPRGIRKFIVSWLQREQDKHGRS